MVDNEDPRSTDCSKSIGAIRELIPISKYVPYLTSGLNVDITVSNSLGSVSQVVDSDIWRRFEP